MLPHLLVQQPTHTRSFFFLSPHLHLNSSIISFTHTHIPSRTLLIKSHNHTNTNKTHTNTNTRILSSSSSSSCPPLLPPFLHNSSSNKLYTVQCYSFATGQYPEYEDPPANWYSKFWKYVDLAAIAVCAIAVGKILMAMLNPPGDENDNIKKKPENSTSNSYVSRATAAVLAMLPFRLTSYLWGSISSITLPKFLRSPVYSAYAKVFGCKLDEVALPLDEYPSLAAFFSRSLRPGCRVWVAAPGTLGSPVDGTVYYAGRVDGHTLEQVKGVKYTLPMFLGENSPIVADALQGKNLYHISIYLAPGDYHGIHSPTDWVVKRRKHIPGKLLPVAPFVVKRVEGIFAANERVVLEGVWAHGHFALTPVGASNVGSIRMKFDSNLVTNEFLKPKELMYERLYEGSGLKMDTGQEVALFHMGSTVVLIFECPANREFEFTVKPGDKLKLGEPIGVLKVVEPQKEAA